MKNLIVIGSAGRHADPRYTQPTFYNAATSLSRFITWMKTEGQGPVRLVSGGAPWADHLATALFVAGVASELRLALPAEWDPSARRFNAAGDGRRFNQLHDAFSEALGYSSFGVMAAAIEMPGCETTCHAGFFARNDIVAAEGKEGDGLIAFSMSSAPVTTAIYTPTHPGFNDHKQAGFGRGGTSYTWSRARRVSWKIHQDFGCFAKGPELLPFPIFPQP